MVKKSFLTFVLTLYGMTALAAEITPQRQTELIRFVRQECGFCHGLKLTGGLGSSLSAEAMKDKPVETLTAAILYGIPGTAMPAWTPHLNEAEAVWVARQLQKGFPE